MILNVHTCTSNRKPAPISPLKSVPEILSTCPNSPSCLFDSTRIVYESVGSPPTTCRVRYFEDRWMMRRVQIGKVYNWTSRGYSIPDRFGEWVSEELFVRIVRIERSYDDGGHGWHRWFPIEISNRSSVPAETADRHRPWSEYNHLYYLNQDITECMKRQF